MSHQFTISVLFFARAKEITNNEKISIDVPEGATVENLLKVLTEQFPELNKISNHLLFSINNDYVSNGTKLHEGDEVGCFPPVSGG